MKQSIYLKPSTEEKYIVSVGYSDRQEKGVEYRREFDTFLQNHTDTQNLHPNINFSPLIDA